MQLARNNVTSNPLVWQRKHIFDKFWMTANWSIAKFSSREMYIFFIEPTAKSAKCLGAIFSAFKVVGKQEIKCIDCVNGRTFII